MLKNASRRSRDRRRTCRPLRTEAPTVVPSLPPLVLVPAAACERIGAALADKLGAHDCDMLIKARDNSMEAAGIVKGSFVIMRPLSSKDKPKPGDIVAVIAVRSGGPGEFILKRWQGLANGLPVLVDGAGNAYPLPSDTAHAYPFAIARGALTAFGEVVDSDQ